MENISAKERTLPEIPSAELEHIIFLKNLPDEFSREYELKLTDYANSYTQSEIGILEKLIRDFNTEFNRKIRKEESTEKKTAEEESVEEKIAYAAFYTLNIIYRRRLDKEAIDRLWTENQSWVMLHESYIHLKITLIIKLGLDVIKLGADDSDDEEKLLEQDYTFLRKHHENAGYCHALCDLYATLCEKNEDLKTTLGPKWKKRVFDEIDYAITKAPDYAKTYCTKGRILAIDGQFDRAEEMIREAISREDSAYEKYILRMIEYEGARLRIQAKRLVAETGVEAIQKEIGNLKQSVRSNIEIVAFFSGIVSFVIGSLSLAQNQTAAHASLLIIALMGCLISVYAAFVALLRSVDASLRKEPLFCVAILGGLVAAASTYLTLHM